MEWARSQAQSALRLPRQQPHSEHLSQDLHFPWKANEIQSASGPETWDNLLKTNSTQELMTWESDSANVDFHASLVEYDSTLFNSIPNNNDMFQEESQAELFDALNSAHSLSNSIPPYFSSASVTSIQQASDHELDSMYYEMRRTSQASQDSQSCSSIQSTSSKSPRVLSGSAWMPFNQQSSQWNSPLRSPSPFSIDQRMIATSNCHMTSENLLRIYHDVLEHNFSCWLSETTCPYQSGAQDGPQPIPEWGSSWSNRIYQRTIRLDRVAQSCKLLQLTRTEDQAASKALHLAIMAFATQWAQSSYRHHERYYTKTFDDKEDELATSITDEFDRNLQHHFWDQAQLALQQVADLESYRVVCAELILGLTQRPWNPDRQSSGQEMQQPRLGFATDSVLSKLQAIMHKEGPPIYMERAARKVHALKYRCDALERGLGRECSNRGKRAHGIGAMSPEDRGTIGLLYWLAIMVDTISSSMNERPVVVLDQDCEHERQKDNQQIGIMDDSVGRGRWNLDLFMQGNLKETRQTQWPCSYEAAAKDVVRSAPIKVLLFRHLSYLQNAIRQGVHREQIEDIISTTMSLYKYWNRTHGAFFGQLVQNYDAVPQRIQGWFLCISAHWHLAVLMFADLLEIIDENALATEDATSSRITSQTARRLRKHSARELSDLARVGTPPTRDGNLVVPQMSELHHAVNEGTLLTEPWTMILIRAFTKACMVFLSEADGSLRCAGISLRYDHYDIERNLEQAEHCAKGLWLLGKKSDMAREISETLSLAIGEVRKPCVV
ncbi:hypothetical protein N7475_001975 [Penicillium sp. IBT 31633x]|nr:hypothetical protein N7475_001975 [Penicillium sp. IBT 31633x]